MPIVDNALPNPRPRNQLDEDVYDDGYLRVEHQNYYLSCRGEVINLPRTEFLLLSRLVRSIERVVPAVDLWRSAWGDTKPLNSESLHVYIYRLRGRLLPFDLQIDTMVHVGYRLHLPKGLVAETPPDSHVS